MEFPRVSTSPSMKKRTAASTSKSRSMAAKEMTEGRDSFFASSNASRKPYDFDLASFAADAAFSRDASPDLFSRRRTTPAPSSKTKTTAATTISDLKASVASRIESLKRHLDVCHFQIVNEFDVSSTRLSKRFKVSSNTYWHRIPQISSVFYLLFARKFRMF